MILRESLDHRGDGNVPLISCNLRSVAMQYSIFKLLSDVIASSFNLVEKKSADSLSGHDVVVCQEPNVVVSIISCTFSL